MDLSHEDVTKLLEVIDGSANLDDVELVLGGVRLHVQRGAEPRVNAPRPPPPAIAVPTDMVRTDQMTAVRAPVLGTFRRAPEPGGPSFVEVGQPVKAGDAVGHIRTGQQVAVVTAPVAGVVTGVLAEDGALVEYGQELVILAPQSGEP